MGVVERSLEVRKKVLYDSLAFEEALSELAAFLLNISDSNKSYSFGNSSKALSFNQKVYLLIDIGALDKEAITKFLKFMEIRNQFMHNSIATNFINCMAYIDGCEKYLMKNYNFSKTSDRETMVRDAYDKLVSDIFQILTTIQQKVMEKLNDIIHNKTSIALNKYYKTNINHFYNVLSKMFSEIKEGKVSNYEDFQKAQDEIMDGMRDLKDYNIEMFKKEIIK